MRRINPSGSPGQVPRWLAAALIAAGMLANVQAQVQNAGTLFVNVDATALPEGPVTTVPNTGTIGGVFAPPANADETPRVATVGGTKGIQFDGSDFLQHLDAAGGTPIFAPEGLVGENPTRSIEVWVVNPAIAAEETLVSWAHRGGAPDGSNMSFNYGSSFQFGAVGHWGNRDIGWNNQGGAPQAGVWHHLVYTYDGTTTRLYADGAFQNGEFLGEGAIVTHADTAILIGAQTEPDAFSVTGGLRLSGTIGRVRIHDGVLTDEQVAANYNAERAAFINPTVPPPPVVTPERLTAGPVHRYSFSAAAGDATGGEIRDSVGTAHGTVLGEGATFNGSRLVLPGGPSLTAAYGDLPNSLLSSNSAANGGSGGFTFETWARFTGSRTWSRVFDFGSSAAGIDTGEVFEPGGSGNGLDYFMLSAQIGGDVNTRRFEIRNNEDPIGEESALADVPTRTFNTDTHLVATWDEASGLVNLYENGVRTGGFTADDTMADINDVNMWLGRSNWMADENAQVEYDEVRLYNYALTAGQAMGNSQAGPDGLNNAEFPVTIVTQPQSVTAAETGDATFRVSAPGSSPVSIQWLRNGAEIPGATAPTLTLPNLTSADNGAIFTVRVSNTVNGAPVIVTSEPATLTVTTPQVTLKHRYSFNETSGTTVADSVGSRNGTVFGNATFGDGELTLDGVDAYVDLPNGIITELGADGTFEFWVTHQNPAFWSRIFDFGLSTDGEDAQGGGVDFLFLTPRMGDGFPRFVANFPDGGDLVTLDPAPPGWIPGNEQTHIVITWSSSGNISRLFMEGVLVATGIAPRPLSAMNNQDVNNWLGRSQFNDAYWGGKYNEVRLYTGAMPPSQAQASFAAGPGSLPTAAPRVTAQVTANNFVISWPAAATGFTLESSLSLDPGATWTAAGSATPSGDQMQVTVPLEGSARFFRLRSP